jgi:hypothetical protein
MDPASAIEGVEAVVPLRQGVGPTVGEDGIRETVFVVSFYKPTERRRCRVPETPEDEAALRVFEAYRSILTMFDGHSAAQGKHERCGHAVPPARAV